MCLVRFGLVALRDAVWVQVVSRVDLIEKLKRTQIVSCLRDTSDDFEDEDRAEADVGEET